MHYIIVHHRIMEGVRQQNEVKYVAHNRVSDSHFPVTIATDLIFSLHVGCTSHSN